MLRKASFNNTVEFVTTSMEQGILLPCNPLVEFVVKAALARAARLHAIEICHLLVNGNHVHMIVAIKDPEALPQFMERFKTESSHYINRLLGRKKRTIWCEGYDNPTVLTVRKVIEKIVYLYINPAKDGIYGDIDTYPGFSTWGAFTTGLNGTKAHVISRDILQKIPTSMNYDEYRNNVKLLKRNSHDHEYIKFSPNSWMKCFGITEKEQIKSINELIKRRVKEVEKKYKLKREKPYPTKAFLQNQGFKVDYMPQRQKGRKTWCISSDVKKRTKFINNVKILAQEARQVYKNWRKGDFSKAFPAGMFPPRMQMTKNLLPDFC